MNFQMLGFPYNAGVKCNTFGVINNFLKDVQVEILHVVLTQRYILKFSFLFIKLVILIGFWMDYYGVYWIVF